MDTDADLTGRRVGRYEIRSLLGRGGMGAVYRAWDATLDRHVAIKILPAHLVTDPDRVRRFVLEAKSASALNHPNVISIYDIGQDGSLHYIAMELVEGTTLRDALVRGAVDRKRAIAIAEEVAAAIAAAHQAGVVHRDLKPENIIIASAGYVKVLDFGVAKLRSEPTPVGEPTAVGATEVRATEVRATRAGVVLGTAGYMSPEQALGKAVDHRSDVFSLGCILYEMVSGRAPFDGDSVVETMFNVIHARPAALDVPRELQPIVKKALAKSPEDRYRSANDLAADLKRLRESDVTGSQPAGAGPGVRRSTLIVAAAVLSAAVAGVLLMPRKQPSPPAQSQPLTIQRITTNGNAILAAVSPDGKYVAYVNSEGGRQGLWLRQLATLQDLQLIAPRAVAFWGHAFSPDGASIYYVVKSTTQGVGTLYAMPILGGRAEKILDGIDSPPAFSPDGKKIAWIRVERSLADTSLAVANADGSDVRVLAKRRAPQSFTPSFTGPAWSPDGKRIAVSLMVRPTAARNRSSVIEVDAATGRERVITSGWGVTEQVTWLPDGSGLAVVGEYNRYPSNKQLWLVPMPSGEPRPITNDLSDYRMVSVTADGSALVTIQLEFDADLWLVPFDTARPPRKLRAGKRVGTHGLSVARDGSIAYISLDSGDYDLWIADSDGTDARRVTTDSHRKQGPVFTPDGKTIIFTGDGPAGAIRRIAADGSQKRSALLYEEATSELPALSPDGQTLVFHTASGLVKAPVSGGPITPLTSYRVQRPAISPDGTRVAGYCGGEVMRICIIPMSGGAPEKTFEAAPAGLTSMIRWADDGRALLLNTMPNDRSNIWRFPLDGRAPKRLTNFPEQPLYRFDLTPDRKAFVVSRGEVSRDAMRITGFR
ncbi:MAG TPA: protein kinase [Thermoanaerobaculia bacterium]